MIVELTSGQIEALLAILSQTTFIGSEIDQVAALFAALRRAIEQAQ